MDGRSHGVPERRTDGRTRTDRRTEGTVLSYGPTPSDGACHCVDRRCCEAELLPAGSWGRRGAGRPPAGAPASHWSEAHLAQCQYGPGPGDAGTAGWTPRTARSSRVSGHPRSAETALSRLARRLVATKVTHTLRLHMLRRTAPALSTLIGASSMPLKATCNVVHHSRKPSASTGPARATPVRLAGLRARPARRAGRG